MKKTIKELNEYAKTNETSLLFGASSGYIYPEIEGNESNFIDDYNSAYTLYDTYFTKKYGERVIEYDADTMAEFFTTWKYEISSIAYLFIPSWARLYYALNIDYNPVFNVEEHTTTTYGEHQTDYDIGERQHTEGQKQKTYGTHEDTSTDSSWAYDSSTWNNSEKTVNNVGQQVDTENEYTNTDSATTDTTTSGEHEDTVDRTGNIGTVSATQLMEQEELFRRNYSFFKNVFSTLINEIGAYYEYYNIYE